MCRIAFIAALMATAATARAEDGAPPQTRWYGWQIMLADAAGIALIFAGAKGDNAAVATAGVSVLVLGSPLIHLAHHAPGDAATSLLVRALPFGASLALFGLIHPECGEGCGELAIPALGLLLSGAGTIVDWIFLSSEPVESRLSLVPAVPFDRRRGAGLALALRF